MKRHVRAGEEVHGVMIRIAAHEAEEIADPVGDAKAEHPLVERHGALDVGRVEGDVSELERPDAGDMRVLGEVVPFLEQLDRRSLVVLERQHLAHAGNGIVAQLAAHAVLGQLPRQLAEVGIGRDFERQFDAVRSIRLVELDHQLPDLGGEKGALLLAFGHDQPHELPVIRDGLFQVRRLEGGVADASRLDHGVISISLSGAAPRPKTMHDYSSIRSGALSAAKPWNHRGLTRGDGFSPRSTHPTLRLSSTYTLDKTEIFGESLRERHRTHGSRRTWPATSSRPTKPPMALAPAWSSTTRCSTPPSSRARAPMRPCSASSRTGRRRKASCAKRRRPPEKAAPKRCRLDAPSCWRRCAGRRRFTAPAPIMPTTPLKWLAA